MAQNPTNTFSGARSIFRIDGAKIAFASGVNGGEEIQMEPVDVLDNLETQEHVPTGYRTQLSCSVFRTVKGAQGATPPREGTYGSLKEMGVFPQAGANPLNILTTGLMVATVHDRLTNKPVSQWEEVKSTGHNFSVTSRGIVGENCNFVAIRLKDESEVA